MSTHIDAPKSAVASAVLLPGDPRRAKWIAGHFLEGSVRYNQARNMDGYTGWVPNGKLVSVQGTGIGMSSLNVYVTELIKDFGVKRLIRVGTAGALQKDMKLGDIVLAQGGCSNSGANLRRFDGMQFAPLPDFDLLCGAREAATRLEIPVRVGNVLSTEYFYNPKPEEWKRWAAYGVLAVEMENAELCTLAAENNVQALTILTISDVLPTGEEMSADDRENTLTNMVRIALEII